MRNCLSVTAAVGETEPVDGRAAAEFNLFRGRPCSPSTDCTVAAAQRRGRDNAFSLRRRLDVHYWRPGIFDMGDDADRFRWSRLRRISPDEAERQRSVLCRVAPRLFA